MPLYDAYGERKAREVKQATWGHLAPQPRRAYRGFMVFAASNFAGQGALLIDAAFEGLDDSPWLFEAVSAYAVAHAEPGHVSRFDGTYTRFKNGGHRFSGTVRRVVDCAGHSLRRRNHPCDT